MHIVIVERLSQSIFIEFLQGLARRLISCDSEHHNKVLKSSHKKEGKLSRPKTFFPGIFSRGNWLVTSSSVYFTCMCPVILCILSLNFVWYIVNFCQFLDIKVLNCSSK